VSAKDLPGQQSEILNVQQFRTINRHPVESGEVGAPEIISDTDNCLNWNGDLDNPNGSEDDCAGDIQSDIEQGNGIEDPKCPEQWDMSATPNVPGSIQPTRTSNRHTSKVWVLVNAMEIWRNEVIKKT